MVVLILHDRPGLEDRVELVVAEEVHPARVAQGDARASAGAAVAVAGAALFVVELLAVDRVTKKGNFDARLTRFKNLLPAFDGAKLVDELETRVEPKSTVTLQIHGAPTTLKVTVLKVEPDLTVKLKVDIDAFKFSAKTTHLRSRATMMVGKMIEKEKGLYLAVTTKVEP